MIRTSRGQKCLRKKLIEFHWKRKMLFWYNFSQRHHIYYSPLITLLVYINKKLERKNIISQQWHFNYVGIIFSRKKKLCCHYNTSIYHFLLNTKMKYVNRSSLSFSHKECHKRQKGRENGYNNGFQGLKSKWAKNATSQKTKHKPGKTNKQLTK